MDGEKRSRSRDLRSIRVSVSDYGNQGDPALNSRVLSPKLSAILSGGHAERPCNVLGVGSSPPISRLEQRKEPLPVLIALALDFAQRFQLQFGICRILTFSFQVDNEALLFCQPALACDHIALDPSQLVVD
ncbi:hypothetical protein ACVW16_007173 [Bradyrhizobium sp. USDA 4474]